MFSTMLNFACLKAVVKLDVDVDCWILRSVDSWRCNSSIGSGLTPCVPPTPQAGARCLMPATAKVSGLANHNHDPSAHLCHRRHCAPSTPQTQVEQQQSAPCCLPCSNRPASSNGGLLTPSHPPERQRLQFSERPGCSQVQDPLTSLNLRHGTPPTSFTASAGRR